MALYAYGNMDVNIKQKVIFGKVEIEKKNFNFNKNKKKMKHCPVVKDVSFKTLKLSLEL